MTVPAAYAYPIPVCFSDVEAAPLLCAGAVGYRALKLTSLSNGEALGLTGFGGSAQRELALALGANWAGPTEARSPFELDAIIDTTPAWLPIVAALKNLKPGGRLVINAIRKEDSDKKALLGISYESHLWQEKKNQSVANVTAADIKDFQRLSGDLPIKPEIQVYDFVDANRALRELQFAPIRGTKVLSFIL